MLHQQFQVFKKILRNRLIFQHKRLRYF